RQRLLVTEQRGGGAGPQRLPHPTGSPLARSKNLYPPPVDQRGAANRGGLAAAERPQTPALNPHPSSFPQRSWCRIVTASTRTFSIFCSTSLPAQMICTSSG